MKHLKTYEQYSDTLILEKIDFKNMLNKLKNSDMKKKKRIAKIVIIGLLSFYTFTQATNIINGQDLGKEDKEILQTELDSIDTATKGTISNDIDSIMKYRCPTTYILTQEGWDYIREEEGCVLTAYKIGDGMITIGYGHAEPISTSQYKVGDKITQERAEELLIEDVNYAAQGVKRMFQQWKDEGINVKITQDQYDVLVSLAYNKGVGGFRNSAFIAPLKKGDLEEAGELIRVESDSRFAGIAKRRNREADKFLS